MNLPQGTNVTTVNPLTTTTEATTKPTDREVQVVELVLTGASNASIATQLQITEKTVKFHMTNVMRKKGLKSRSQLMAEEIRRLQGLVGANAK